eukprot:Skav235741  [mRNA]  locus=scaffold1612:1622:9308:- [translate_table: standard]
MLPGLVSGSSSASTCQVGYICYTMAESCFAAPSCQYYVPTTETCLCESYGQTITCQVGETCGEFDEAPACAPATPACEGSSGATAENVSCICQYGGNSDQCNAGQTCHSRTGCAATRRRFQRWGPVNHADHAAVISCAMCKHVLCRVRLEVTIVWTEAIHD